MLINKISAFGLHISPLRLEQITHIMEDTLNGSSMCSLIINGINAHNVLLAQKLPSYKQYLNESDIVNIDGYSIVLALRILGYEIKERTSCPDLFNWLTHYSNDHGSTIYLWGSKQDILEAATKNLIQKFPNLRIVGNHSGFFEKNEVDGIIEDIRIKKPSIVFLGMPSPMKEYYAHEYLKALNLPIVLGVGGLFEIEAGIIKRAPVWFQRNGLEWFYRFIQEPRRLWKRYLWGNLRFLYLLIKEKVETSINKNQT